MGSALVTLALTIMWSAIGALFFGILAFVWTECSRKDELDRRAQLEIRRAAHHAYTNAQQGRRDTA